MRKDALATELHFVLDKDGTPREAFLLERILYLEDDDTEFAPPRTVRRQITMDDAKAMFDNAAILAIKETRDLANQLADERKTMRAEKEAAVASVRAMLIERETELAAIKDARK